MPHFGLKCGGYLLCKICWWLVLTEFGVVITNAKFKFTMVSTKMLLHISQQIGIVNMADAAAIPTTGQILLVFTCGRELIE